MRICAFGRSLPVHKMGGLEQHFQMITRGLAERGHEVTVITTRHPRGVTYEKEDGVEIYYLEGTLSGRYECGYWRRSLKTFKRLMGHRSYDLVLSESAGAFGYIREKSKGNLDVPVIFIAHGTSLGDIRTKFKQGMPSPKTLAAAVLNLWRYRRDRHYFRYVDMVIGVSPFVTESLRKQYLVDPARLRTLPNCVDLKIFRPDAERRRAMRRRLELSDVHGVILCGGRLERQKGIHLAIEAMPAIMEKLPGARLVIAGQGTYEGKLRRLVARLGLSGEVVFLGGVPNTELAAYYNAADVCLMPSLGYEGLPIMLLEAMASGVPVVASKSGGILDVLADGINGLLVEPHNISGFSESVAGLMQDGELAEKLAGKALSDVRERYSREKMLETLEAVSKEVVERKSA